MTERPFERVAIIGLGLMGGSLARALAGVTPRPRVRAVTLDADTARDAEVDGVVERAGSDLAGMLEDADLVVLATPAGEALRILPDLAAQMNENAVVTDVCSVKRPLVECAAALGLADRFVGSHPMCGSEKSGYAAARADLYRDAPVWIVPAERTATEAVERFWRGLGAHPLRTDAATHDHAVAWVSHLPQILSSVLGTALGRAGVEPIALGPGGRDVTRLAGSEPALWADILLHNVDALDAPLAEAQALLSAFAGALRAGDANALERLLRESQEWAESGT